MTSKFADYKAEIAHMKGVEKQMFDACAQQAEQSAQSLADYLEVIRRSGRAVSQEEYDGLVRLFGDVVNQLIFPVSTAVKAVERSRSNRSEAGKSGTYKFPEDARNIIFEALARYARNQNRNDNDPAAKKWKQVLCNALRNDDHNPNLNLDWRTIKPRLKDWGIRDESELVEFLKEKRPQGTKYK